MRGSGLPQLLPTERPRCPTCWECMDLQRVDPGMRGFENRVFECGRCYPMQAGPAAIGGTKSRSASGPKVGCSAKEDPNKSKASISSRSLAKPGTGGTVLPSFAQHFD